MPGRLPTERPFSMVPPGPLQSPDKGGSGGGRGRKDGEEPGKTPKKQQRGRSNKPQEGSTTPSPEEQARALRRVQRRWNKFIEELPEDMTRYLESGGSNSFFTKVKNFREAFRAAGGEMPKRWYRVDLGPDDDEGMAGGSRRRGGPGHGPAGSGSTADIPKGGPKNPPLREGAAVPVPAGRREDDDR